MPGLNPCIRSITLSADDRGWEVIGFRRGWQGVLEIDPGRSGVDRRQQPAADPRQRARDRPDGRHDPPHVAPRSAHDRDGDKTAQVLEHARAAWRRRAWSRLAAMARCASRRTFRPRAFRSFPSPRRWIMTSSAPIIASASRRRLAARSRRSTRFEPPSEAMSGSASSSCSAGEAARRLSRRVPGAGRPDRHRRGPGRSRRAPAAACQGQGRERADYAMCVISEGATIRGEGNRRRFDALAPRKRARGDQC